MSTLRVNSSQKRKNLRKSPQNFLQPRKSFFLTRATPPWYNIQGGDGDILVFVLAYAHNFCTYISFALRRRAPLCKKPYKTVICGVVTVIRLSKTDISEVFLVSRKKVLDKSTPLWYNRRDLSDSKCLLSAGGTKNPALGGVSCLYS